MYPFEFELTNTYMQEDNKLVFLYKVRNTGDTNMPFGIGGHPAFKIDEDDVKQGNYYLEFEEEEEESKKSRRSLFRRKKKEDSEEDSDAGLEEEEESHYSTSFLGIVCTYPVRNIFQ